MKIACSKCNTKYSIADEKIAGRAFRVRCRKCQQMIVVPARKTADKQPAPEAVEPSLGVNSAESKSVFEQDTRVFDYSGFNMGGSGQEAHVSRPAPQVAAVPEVAWHVVVRGDQVGPYGGPEMRARIIRGEIGPDSFVWRDGFLDWQRLGTLADFSDVLATSTVVTPSSDWAVATEIMPPAQDVAISPVPASKNGNAEASSTPSKETSAPKLTGARSENSVLFSLSDLQDVAMGTATPELSSRLVSAASESTGLADIRTMASAVTTRDTAEDDLVETLGRLSSPTSAPVLLPSAAAPTRPKWLMPTLAGLVGLLLLSMATVGYVLRGKADSAPIAISAPNAVEVAVPASPPISQALPPPATPPPVPPEPAPLAAPAAPPSDAVVQPPPSPPVPAEPKKQEAHADKERHTPRKAPNETAKPIPAPMPAVAAPPTPTPVAVAAATPSPKKGGGSSDELDALLQGAIKGGAFESKSAKKPPAEDPESPYGDAESENLPEQLTTAQLRAAMAAVKNQVQTCYEQHHESGVVNVKLTILSSGRLQSAVVGGKFSGTPTGTCVEKAVKSAHFPPFRSASMSFDYPYVLPIR